MTDQELGAAALHMLEPSFEDIAAQDRAQRLADHASHPHTQLRGIIKELQSPPAQAADINTKFAMLHAAVVRLTQTILAHTPPPPEEPHGEE